MIVTFFNASGIDFGNFLNAHLESETLSPNCVISTIARNPCPNFIERSKGLSSVPSSDCFFLSVLNDCLKKIGNEDVKKKFAGCDWTSCPVVMSSLRIVIVNPGIKNMDSLLRR